MDDNSLKVGSNEMELVDFRILKEENGEIYEGIYGINIAKVREINKIIQFTKMPNCHECIEGLLELRDEAIPIINLAKYLGYKSTAIRPTDNVIICEFNGIVTGFVVHQAMKIRRISWDSISPPAKLVGREGGCVTGMFKLAKGPDNEQDLMLLILDFEKIVAEINGETEMLHKFTEDKQNNRYSEVGDDSKTVLVIDDSLTARTQVELFLTQHGYKVITANDGEEGLFALNTLYEQAQNEGKELFDVVQVVITDVEMPRMDGHAFTQTVRKDPRFGGLPIIMHTSLSGRANQESGKTLADEYVVKFNGEVLIATVDKMWKKLAKERANPGEGSQNDNDQELAS